jgi:hypothetical protein
MLDFLFYHKIPFSVKLFVKVEIFPELQFFEKF